VAGAPELIPEGEVTALSLVALVVLTGWVVAWGLSNIGFYLLQFVHWLLRRTIGRIPLIGGTIDSTIDGWLQQLTNRLGAAITSSEAHIGLAWHNLARQVDHLGRELYGLATLSLIIAKIMTGQATWKDYQSLLRRLKSEIAAGVRSGEHALQRIGVGEKAVTRTVGANLAPRIRTIEHELDHVFTPELRVLRERVKSLEDGSIEAFRWIRTHPLSVGATAFAGAVAIALQRLGGSWIRCSNWNRIGRSVCGLPLSLIEGLLGDLIDVLIIADICELTKLMIRVAESSIVQDALGGIVTGMDELLLCQGVDRPPALDGYWTALPSAQTFAALPA